MDGPEVASMMVKRMPGEGFYLVARQHSPEAHDLRALLVRNRVPFHWVDLDTDPLMVSNWIAMLAAVETPNAASGAVHLAAGEIVGIMRHHRQACAGKARGRPQGSGR